MKTQKREWKTAKWLFSHCTASVFVFALAPVSAFIPPAAAHSLSTYEKGIEQFSVRHFAECIETLKQAVKEIPDDVDAWTELGRAYMMQDRYQEAIAACTRAIELNPKNFRAYTFRAFCYFKVKKIRPGLEDSDKAVDYYQINVFDPTIVWALDNRSRAYKMLARPDLAEADFTLLRNYGLLQQAVKAREWARLNDAISLLDQALFRLPKNSDIWFFRGVVNSNRRDFWAAAADLSNAIRYSPKAWFLYYFRADDYQQVSQHREAVQDLTTLINANPRLPAYRFTCETGRLRDLGLRNDESVITMGDIHFLRAQSLAELGRMNEAIADLNDALKLDPSDTKALSLRAEYVSETGENDNAVRDFTQAIKQSPNEWNKYQQRGNAYLKLGKIDEAMQDFSEIIRRNPKDPGAYLIRALARQNNGEFPGALADYSEVIKLNPNDDDAFLARGQCFRALKKYREALDDFAQAEKLNPENKSLAMEERAKLYVETGEDQLARSQIRTLDSALAAKRPNYLLIGSVASGSVLIGALLLLWRRKRKQ